MAASSATSYLVNAGGWLKTSCVAGIALPASGPSAAAGWPDLPFLTFSQLKHAWVGDSDLLLINQKWTGGLGKPARSLRQGE
jgi:hypothetical protein